MTDNSKMPFGKFKGKAMIEVPGSYLLWLYDSKIAKGELLAYIEDNLAALKLEIKKQQP